MKKSQAYPTRAFIDAAALRANFARVRSSVPSGIAVLATVKADAYGHGAALVAPVLAEAGADLFGVATVAEGTELRDSGIRQPVLVFTGTDSEGVAAALQHDLSVAVFDADHARDLAAGAGTRTLRVHVKLDTGMTRLGATPEALPALLQALRTAPQLRVEGVFSHLANAGHSDTEFTDGQIRVFRQGVQALREAGLDPRWVHLANSIATLTRAGECGNVVRPGIVLYGAGPMQDPAGHGWQPVMHLRTRIWQRKSVAPGTAVGYEQTFVTRRPTRIAVLPIGYADGYPRGLSNHAQVLVRGRRAPVIGNVCMDLTMIDVTDVPEVSVGDDVVLWGRQGAALLSVNEVAAWGGTIAYELLTRVGRRVPRVLLDSRQASGH